jgi:hypothetical protein
VCHIAELPRDTRSRAIPGVSLQNAAAAMKRGGLHSLISFAERNRNRRSKVQEKVFQYVVSGFSRTVTVVVPNL